MSAAPLAEAATQALRAHAMTGQAGKARDFFRECVRCLPWALQNYKLQELTTVPQLRRNIASMFRENADVTSPDVINLLIYKGREELEMIILQHKQRHHIISKYLAPFEEHRLQKATSASRFLQDFYKGNTMYG